MNICTSYSVRCWQIDKEFAEKVSNTLLTTDNTINEFDQMKFNPEHYKEAKWKFWLFIGFFLFLALFLIKDSFKTRNDFKVIIGKVTEQGNTRIKMVQGFSYSHAYYFRLSNHGQLFGVGTNDEGIPILDSSFKGLNVGDIVQVTYEENWATKNQRVNQVVHEIVREGNVLYDNIPGTYWNGRMKIGLVCLAIGVCLLTVAFILNKKYKRLTTTIISDE